MNTIQISSGELKNICVSASSAARGSGVWPALDCLKFEVVDNELKVTGSDLDNTVIKRVKYLSSVDFSFCIDSKRLCETLKELPETGLSLEVHKDLVVIRSAIGGEYRLPNQGVSEYPEVGALNEKSSILFGPDLVEYIGSIKSMVGTNELKISMTGIFIEKNGEDLTFVSTDGHRLGWTELNAPEDANDFDVIVSDRIYKNLKSNYTEGNVRLAIGEKNVACVLEDGTEIYARQIDAKYPSYRTVIPEENSISVSIDTRALLGCLKRVSVYANKSTNQILVSISNDGKMIVSAQDLDFNNEANEVMDVEFISGEGISIGLNSKYLMDMLSLIPSETFTLHMSTPNKAAIVTSQLADNETDNPTKYLLMPVMVSN